VVRLTALAGVATAPSFSPDGTQIAFDWNGDKQDNYDVYAKMLGNAAALRLTTDPAYDFSPAWSPDGRQIAFVSAREPAGIYLTSPLGGSARKLFDMAVNEYANWASGDAPDAPIGLSWSSDGKFLVMARVHNQKSSDPDNGAVMVIPVEGGGEPRRILSPTRGHWYTWPAVSPDGRRLAVVSCTGTGVPSCRLEVLALNAELLPQGTPRAVAGPVFFATGIAWTGDGNSLVVGATGIGSSANPEPYLWRIPVEGAGDPERLELAGAGASWPAVDVRRHRLAFSRNSRRIGIWQWTPGGKSSPFLEDSLTGGPQFSHDGRRVAFSSTRSGDERDIWVANADGTGLVQVTSGISHYCGSQRWSPDDQWLAFDAWGKNGRWDVWVVDAGGGRARSLTHGPGDNAVPSWSSDRKWIYFFSGSSGRDEIWRAPAQGGPAEQVTKEGARVALESTDGKTLYYTRSEGGAEGLFAMALPSGEEQVVFPDPIVRRGFEVFPDGIYYITGKDPNYEIRFYEFSIRRSRKIGGIEGPLQTGLAVSPDRKTFLYSRSFAASDLWMIENFR